MKDEKFWNYLSSVKTKTGETPIIRYYAFQLDFTNFLKWSGLYEFLQLIYNNPIISTLKSKLTVTQTQTAWIFKKNSHCIYLLHHKGKGKMSY